MGGDQGSVRLTTSLILINAAVWLSFAIIVGAGWHPSLPPGTNTRVVLALLAALAAGALVVLVVLLRKRSRAGYYLTLGALAVLAVLTVLDEVGLADLVVLGLTLGPLVLLVKDRRWYLPGSPG